jgi:hypothetical protein
MGFPYWGNSRVLPTAKNGTRESQVRAKPTESVSVAPVEAERPTADSNFELLALCAGAVLLLCIIFAPVLSWIIAVPLFLILLLMELHQPLEINKVALTAICLVFAAPCACDFSAQGVALFGAFGNIWVHFSNGYVSMFGDIATGMVMIGLQIVPQIISLAVLSKYFEGVISKQIAALAAICSEVPFGLMLLFAYILNPPPEAHVLFPFPFALIIGLTVLWLFPPQRYSAG